MNITLKIEGMSCGHCTASVTRALHALPGTSDIEVSLEKNTASLKYDENLIDEAAIKNAIFEIGYEVID